MLIARAGQSATYVPSQARADAARLRQLTTPLRRLLKTPEVLGAAGSTALPAPDARLSRKSRISRARPRHILLMGRLGIRGYPCRSIGACRATSEVSARGTEYRGLIVAAETTSLSASRSSLFRYRLAHAHEDFVRDAFDSDGLSLSRVAREMRQSNVVRCVTTSVATRNRPSVSTRHPASSVAAPLEVGSSIGTNARRHRAGEFGDMPIENSHDQDRLGVQRCEFLNEFAHRLSDGCPVRGLRPRTGHEKAAPQQPYASYREDA